MRRYLILFGVVLALVAAYRYWPSDSEQGKAPPPSPVHVTQLTKSDWVDVLEAVGTARADEQVNLTARITEKVAEVRFEEGQAVKKGDPLIVLATREAAAQLAEAEASLADAEREYNRIKDLPLSAIPKAGKDQRRARREEARARAEAARSRLGDRVIAAPFDGIIGLRNVSPGTLVEPGDVVATLADTRRIKVDASLPESTLSRIQAGMAVEATSTAWPGKRFQGTVMSLDNRVDPITRAITIRAVFENPEGLLKPGMMLSLHLATAARQVLAVPEEAISQQGTKHFIYRVGAGSKAEQRPVTIGERKPGMVEVLEGVAEGEKLIISGSIRLRDGAPVMVTSEVSASRIE